MPYDGEYASKLGHAGLVGGQGGARFLRRCAARLDAPSTDFESIDPCESLPDTIVACDGSLYVDASEAQVGFVQVGVVSFDVQEYRALRASRYVDPSRVAQFHRRGRLFDFYMPGRGVLYAPERNQTIAGSFRHALRDAFAQEVFGASLLQTLLALHGGQIRVPSCPACGRPSPEGVLFTDPTQEEICDHCWSAIYPTDVLEIDDEVSESGSNERPIGRVMQVAEHLAVAAAMRSRPPAALARMAFILDGPMALYGPPARLSAALLRHLQAINEQQRLLGLAAPLVIAIQKTGAIVEHLAAIQSGMPDGSFRLIDEVYRKRFIRPAATETFGRDTHYGQDILLKTRDGRAFVMSLPLETRAGRNDVDRYRGAIARAASLIEFARFDLYPNALIPVSLAHRLASISSTSGGRVLQAFTREHLDRPGRLP